MTNTGETAIRRLKVQIDRYDSNQNLIDSQDRSVVSIINPPLLPGETYLTRSSASLKAPFSHYTLKVIELE